LQGLEGRSLPAGLAPPLKIPRYSSRGMRNSPYPPREVDVPPILRTSGEPVEGELVFKKEPLFHLSPDLQELPPGGEISQISTDIAYTAHRISDAGRVFLPDEVKVTLRYKDRTFRNIHRYSDYKLFTVETFEKREPVGNPVK
jgi:hypothetical protein